MTTIDAERFRVLIAAHGAAPTRWPADERDAAHALADTPAGQAIVAEALALDDLLDRHPAPLALALNPLAIAARASAQPQSAMPGAGWWRRAMMAAAAAGIAGLVLGWTVAPAERNGEYRRAVADAALDLTIMEDATW